jgi:uncharacterized protein YciI
MPIWEDYKQEAKSRGALAFELYVVRSVPVASPEEIKANLADHLAYQARLESEGKLVLAGPLSDETGTLMEALGMMVYRARSFEEARALAEADPMHERGARRFELRRWLINEGSLTLSVRLSGQSVELT